MMHKLGAVLLCGIGAQALATGAVAQIAGAAIGATPATAQTTPDHAALSPAGAPDTTTAQADATETVPSSDVVVTGSRIIRNGDQAPQPLTLIRTDDLLKQRPSTIADGLNDLPIFAGSRGPNTSITTTGNGAGGNGAANQLSLRGLGSIRNLILFDGQRLPTALFNGVVDVDIVPDALIERTDIVTGGVSAVYGSDAISGVVNFVTNNNFEGLKAEAFAGVSARDDAPQHKLTIAGGAKLFGGRGHVEASYTNYFSDPLFFRTDRKFGPDYAYGGLLTPTSTYGAAGTATNPYVLIKGNTRNSSASFGGKITSGLYNNYTFNNDGVLSPFNFGIVTASTNLSIGGDGYFNNPSFGATQRSNQGFSRFDFDVTDDIHFHTQGIVSVKDNTVFGNYAQVANFTIRSDNPFLPQSVRTALAAANQPYFTFAKALSNAPRLQDDVHTSQYYVNGGLDGKLSRFDWGVDLNYGHSKLHNRLSGNLNNQHLAAAADATTVNGQIVCRINADGITTNDDSGCVPINLFGPTAASSAAYNYILGQTNLYSVNETFEANAHIGGELFDLLGAGAARFALSGDYRTNSLTQTVDVSSSATANCSGLVINPVNTATQQTYANNCIPVGAVQRNANGTTTPLTPTALFVNAFAPLATKTQRVKEVALEVLLPILKDSVIARSLEASGAVRYADYNTSGHAWVWKGGVNWQLFDDLRLRGTVSRDFRAPTLNDLYQSPTTTVVNNADLLTGVSFLQGRTQGNPSLRPEVSHTWTLGAVYKPSYFRGFSIALDYYHIKITNAIQSVSGFSPAVQTACLASGGTSPFCALQPRPNGYTDTSASNAPYYWITQVLNFATIETEGVDADANYSTRLFGRPFNARVLTSWQPHLRFGDQPGATASTTSFDAAGAANADGTVNNITPRWRVNGSVHVEPLDFLAFDLRERWRSSLRYNPITTTYFAQRVPAAAYTDLTVTFKLPSTDRFQLFLNVQNLLDKQPPPYQTGILPGQGVLPGDDYIGRYFIAGVRTKF